MVELKTKRLRIIALSLENLKLLIENQQKMEKNIGLKSTGERLDKHVKIVMETSLKDGMKDEENYLWYTNWQIVLKEENRSIGSVGFKGCCNENGEVEIGYGIQPEYQRKGYMTEALKEMVKWAFEQLQITSVIAETEKTNIASYRVLEKIGMVKYIENEQYFWWKIKKTQSPNF